MMIFWYVFPLLLLLGCKFVITTFSLDEKYKIKTPDLSVPFLFIGIHYISKDSFHHSFFPYLLLSLLLLGIIIAIGQAYYFGELDYKRYFKMFWRMIFLFLMIAYVILVIFSIAFYLK